MNKCHTTDDHIEDQLLEDHIEDMSDVINQIENVGKIFRFQSYSRLSTQFYKPLYKTMLDAVKQSNTFYS